MKLIFVKGRSALAKDIIKLLVKEYKIEFRNYAVLITSVIFTFSLILSVSLFIQGAALTKQFQAIIIWIILLFSSFNFITHIFLREEEQGTALFLKLYYSADKIFIAKFIYNLCFIVFITITSIPLFIIFLQVIPADYLQFCLTLLCGAATISSTLSFLGALAAKAGQGPALLSILAFPVILPVMWINIKATLAALTNQSILHDSYIFWASISCLTLSLSLILFKYIWHD